MNNYTGSKMWGTRLEIIHPYIQTRTTGTTCFHADGKRGVKSQSINDVRNSGDPTAARPSVRFRLTSRTAVEGCVGAGRGD